MSNCEKPSSPNGNGRRLWGDYSTSENTSNPLKPVSRKPINSLDMLDPRKLNPEKYIDKFNTLRSGENPSLSSTDNSGDGAAQTSPESPRPSRTPDPDAEKTMMDKFLTLYIKHLSVLGKIILPYTFLSRSRSPRPSMNPNRESPALSYIQESIAAARIIPPGKRPLMSSDLKKIINPDKLNSPCTIDMIPFITQINGERWGFPSGAAFELDGLRYSYIGFSPDGKNTFCDTGNGDVIIFPTSEVASKATFLRFAINKYLPENFVGEDSMRWLERLFECNHISASFDTNGIDMPYSVAKLEQASKENRALIITPHRVSFNVDGYEYNGPITFKVLKILFGQKYIGGARIFSEDTMNNGQLKRALASEALTGGLLMPARMLLQESKGKPWANQEGLLQSGEKVPSALELLWVLICSKILTDKILTRTEAFSATTDDTGQHVGLGFCDESGISMRLLSPDYSHPKLGILPTK